MDDSSVPLFIDPDTWKRARYFTATRKALDYIEKHYSTTIDLDVVANAACMEKTAFSHAFKRRAGLTFQSFLWAYRVGMAAVRMTASDQPISEIAFEVGFGSLATFDRVFKKVTGQTASDYRSQLLRRLVPPTRPKTGAILPTNAKSRPTTELRFLPGHIRLK